MIEAATVRVLGVHHFAGSTLHLAGFAVTPAVLRRSLRAQEDLLGAREDLDIHVHTTVDVTMYVYKIPLAGDGSTPAHREGVRTIRAWQEQSARSDVPRHPLAPTDLLGPLQTRTYRGTLRIGPDALELVHDVHTSAVFALDRGEQYQMLASLTGGSERESALTRCADAASEALLDLLEYGPPVLPETELEAEVGDLTPPIDAMTRLLRHDEAGLRQRALLLCRELRGELAAPNPRPTRTR